MLQRIFKYISFEKVERPKLKTEVYTCINNTTETPIGTVKWKSQWRQYCFFPQPNTVFSVGCLDDIKTFIGSLKDDS